MHKLLAEDVQLLREVVQRFWHAPCDVSCHCWVKDLATAADRLEEFLKSEENSNGQK